MWPHYIKINFLSKNIKATIERMWNPRDGAHVGSCLNVRPAFADFPRHLPAPGMCVIRLYHSESLGLFPCLPAPGSLPLSPCFSSYFMEATELAWLKNDFYGVAATVIYLHRRQNIKKLA